MESYKKEEEEEESKESKQKTEIKLTYQGKSERRESDTERRWMQREQQNHIVNFTFENSIVLFHDFKILQ